MSLKTITEPLTDNVGGYHPDAAQAKWPIGSIFANEGERLYRLVRKHKPKVVVEVGTMWGCGSSHIALALKHNGFGHLYTIDNKQQLGDETGSMIPKALGSWVTLIADNALAYEWPKDKPIDFLFEDGQHTTGFTRTILTRYPAKVVAVHDFCHRTASECVAQDARDVLGTPTEIFLEPPSDCGMAIWEPVNYTAVLPKSES